MKSEFTGGLLGLIGISIAQYLITAFTFGFGTPWAICMKERWLAKHTTIDEQKLIFDGTSGQLFGCYIKWFLLSLITFGIYGLWLGIKMKQWTVQHTHVLNNNTFASSVNSSGNEIKKPSSLFDVANGYHPSVTEHALRKCETCNKTNLESNVVCWNCENKF